MVKTKKFLTLFILILVLSPLFLYAEDKDKKEDFFVETLSDSVIKDINADLEKWTDQKMIEELSKIVLNDEEIKKLYLEFKNTIVNPPNPDNYKEYSIENGEESLRKVTQLGQKIHNLGLAISDEDFKKYGTLLQIMRDVLYLDSKHIPLAIKHDNSRDVFWYQLHNKWAKEAEDIYNERKP
jgi:hypothetical protein